MVPLNDDDVVVNKIKTKAEDFLSSTKATGKKKITVPIWVVAATLVLGFILGAWLI